MLGAVAALRLAAAPGAAAASTGRREFCTSFVCTVFGDLSSVFGYVPADSKLFTSLSTPTSKHNVGLGGKCLDGSILSVVALISG